MKLISFVSILKHRTKTALKKEERYEKNFTYASVSVYIGTNPGSGIKVENKLQIIWLTFVNG